MFKKTSPQGKPEESGPQPGQQSAQPPASPVRKLNLKTATREEMIEFIKQYNAHTKQVEARSREVYENYRSTFIEKERINTEYNRVRSGCETIANNLALEDPDSVVAAMLRDMIGSNGNTQIVDKDVSQKYVALLQGIRELRRQNEENKKAITLLKSALVRNIANIDPQHLQLQKENLEALQDQIKHDQQEQQDQLQLQKYQQAQEQLQNQNRELEELNKELKKQSDELKKQNDEFRRQSEELRKQSEESKKQSEESIKLNKTLEEQVRQLHEQVLRQEEQFKRQEEQIQQQQQLQDYSEKNKKLLEEKKEIEDEKEGLKAKVNKLQQLISKAREQLESKSKLLAEKTEELSKVKADLESFDAINEECRIRLLEAESQREKLEDSMRTFHRESVQRQEALEERALTAESELVSVKRDFEAYKERVVLAQAPQPSSSMVSTTQVEDFINFQSENELLKTRVGEAEKLNKSYEQQLAEKSAQIRKSNEEMVALKEEISAAEIQHKQAISELEKEFSEKLSNFAKSLEEYKERYEGQLDEAHKESETLRANLHKAEEELKTTRKWFSATKINKTTIKEKKLTNTNTLSPEMVGSDNTPARSEQKKEGEVKKKTFPQIDLSRAIEAETTAKKPVVPNIESAANGSTAAQGPPLFIMAKVQEQKDNTIAQLKAQNVSLEQKIIALEEESHYHEAQEALLREQLRKATACSSAAVAKSQTGSAATAVPYPQLQGGINIEYLKNIIIKYMETDEHDRLIPVISTIFGMTQEEVKKINETRKARIAASSYGIKNFVTLFSPSTSSHQSYSPQIPTSYEQK